MSKGNSDTTKRLVILAIDDAWRRFRASFNELRSEDADEPGACGEWSVNQILWHIGAWEQLLMDALETPDDGYDYPEPDADTFNAEAISTMVDASPREVIERLDSTHRKLRDALANPRRVTSTESLRPRSPTPSPHRRVVFPALRRTRRTIRDRSRLALVIFTAVATQNAYIVPGAFTAIQVRQCIPISNYIFRYTVQSRHRAMLTESDSLSSTEEIFIPGVQT